jgi:eukaryotic-like serine/threonine-protein kinase
VDWDPPRELDDYVLLAPLGAGHMGKVYLAEDTMLARQVAVKFLADVEPDAAARQRFLLEARAAARVQHPNVVTIYRVGEYQEKPYLITEFVRGKPLADLPKPVPFARVLELGIDLARGLAAAHRNGVLHRDIKSTNVMVAEDGAAKLLDFGLAALLTGPDGDAAGGGGMVGTPDYMAPEIWRAEPATRRSDIYSLGVVLYELASGRLPFADVPMDALEQAVTAWGADPLVAAAPVDGRLGAIVDRCLARDPAQRYASADELRAALEALARSATGAPVPSGNPYRGLRTFEADHRAVFFGRGAEIGAILDRLRTQSEVVITGDSGVGKSSLCRAGVIPAILDGALAGGRSYRVVRLVPGKHPLQALAAALDAELGVTAGATALRLASDAGGIGREVGQALGRRRGLVLFVDPLEELVTVSDPEEARAVEAALAGLADGGPGLRLLATARADFLTRLADLPRLGDDLSRTLYFLRPLPRERIREVIVGPAEATGVRFESEELVASLVEATAEAAGALPLLQFALAQLWEARDRATGTIARAALDSVGGVAGALAGHSDGVVATLPAAHRRAARRILTRLVTADGTRVRRSASELDAADPAGRAALEALVRGRLLVAYDADAGTAYELAHEVLIRGWDTLRRWLGEDKSARVARERLAAAAADWRRLGRSDDALWAARQLAEVAALGDAELSELGETEGEFLRRSRRGLARARWRRRAVAALLPLVAVGVYTGARFAEQADTDRRVHARLAAARRHLDEAHALAALTDGMRGAAFRLFDGRDRAAAETVWSAALADDRALDRGYTAVGQELEAALARDPEAGALRAVFAEVLYERALLAERDHKLEQRDELVQRFTLYDSRGERARRWDTPAMLGVSSDPPAEVTVERFGEPDADGRRASLGTIPLGTTPLAARRFARGLYTLVFKAPGAAEVRAPVVLARGETLSVHVRLPREGAVPPGFVYVPAGRFLHGSAADEESRRGFFDAVPLHPAATDSYLIARNEVTFGDWLGFLDQLPPAERTRRRPAVAARVGSGESLDLGETRGGWRLTLQPAGEAYQAQRGEAIRYRHRGAAAGAQDWLHMPVLGISAEDAEAYVAWLRASGRLPGARLCDELEWERAARGADEREYPHGSKLRAEEANFDETYTQAGMGPDEVGTHPGSRSPFGVDDMAGNANEWTRAGAAPGQYVVRGGSYYHDRKTAQVANRSVAVATLHDSTLGLRVCADVEPLVGDAGFP